MGLAGVDPITYGFEPGSRYAVRVDHLGPEGARGTLTVDGGDIPLSLRIDGAHNLLDAAAAIASAHVLGVDPAAAAATLASFGGVHRRFELRVARATPTSSMTTGRRRPRWRSRSRPRADGRRRD